MLGNRIAFSEHDDIWENQIESRKDDDRDPDEEAEGLGEVELQHESTDTEFEGRHGSQVAGLAEPEILQVSPVIFFRDRRVPGMLSSTCPCG